MTTHSDVPQAAFTDFALQESIHSALEDAGYQSPTPIQAQTIPVLLDGSDLIAQAQTGTGKTAAFALPLLSKIDVSNQNIQVLVLAPTRELANQVADGFNKYSKHIRGLRVLPVYGGSEYDNQLRNLRRGVHVVVGTPGRVMDHIRRGTLKLDGLSSLVLDEADEMLRMGFIDDVEWVLEQIPNKKQIALFSATMPTPIRRIAKKYLNEPKEVIIESRLVAAESIRQRYLIVPGAKKANALVRILEMEDHDGVMVFVKTKTSTVEVAEKLVAHGLKACALNGDLSQNLRERTVDKLKKGALNIIVATDVAARGLDVERISHVFNFDIPNDRETYIHRIGRTGRAGRSGEAILFLAPADRRIVDAITRSTQQPLSPMNIPSVADINQKRIAQFNDKITHTLENVDTSFFKTLIENYVVENDTDPLAVSSAVAHILQGRVPLLLKEEELRYAKDKNGKSFVVAKQTQRDRQQRRPQAQTPSPSASPSPSNRRPSRDVDADVDLKMDLAKGMEQFKLDVGSQHGVTVSNIVGAIANEANISSKYIGRAEIFEDFSTVELPKDMPRKLWRSLKTVLVCNQPLNISKLNPGPSDSSPKRRRSSSHRNGENSRNASKSRTFSASSKKMKRSNKSSRTTKSAA